MTKKRGLFVTLDGPSGVGKTAVAGQLHELLHAQNRKSLLLSTPSCSAIGSLARHGTHDLEGAELTCLVAADRYHCVRTVIEPALASGMNVICDRYMPSSLVLDLLDGLTRDFVWSLYRALMRPDVAFVLTDIADRCTERASIRGGYSRFHVDEVKHSKKEILLYREAIEFLTFEGYPVREHAIGERSAKTIAADLLGAMLERH